MILNKEKIIFIHIPKTAGQAVTKFLLDNIDKKFTLKSKDYGLINNKRNKVPGPKHLHHCNLIEYESLNLVKNIESYFKFTIFRNPYTRFVSAFYYNKFKHNCQTYKDFVKFYEGNSFPETEDLFRHFIPQTWYVNYNLKSLEAYFFQERMDEFEKYFFVTYNFSRKLQIINPRIEVNIDKLDNYTIDFIKKYYKKDFELLGYNDETPKNDSNI